MCRKREDGRLIGTLWVVDKEEITPPCNLQCRYVVLINRNDKITTNYSESFVRFKRVDVSLWLVCENWSAGVFSYPNVICAIKEMCEFMNEIKIINVFLLWWDEHVDWCVFSFLLSKSTKIINLQNRMV